MEDHDQRFKKLVREFFRELIFLFFPEWAGCFNFAKAEWLDKEIFTDVRRGRRRAMDLVAKLPATKAAAPAAGAAGSCLVIIHLEVESRKSAVALRPRICDYYRELRRKHGLPVWPIAIYLHVGLDGVGWDVYEELFLGRVIDHFEYAYVGLPGLAGVKYLEGESLLGVALSVLMAMPAERQAEFKAQALDRVLKSKENAVRKTLLCECIEAYLPLEGPALAEYEDLLLTKYPEVRAMALTTYEKGLVEGQRALLKEMIEERFGPLSPAVRKRLAALSAERLVQVAKALMTADSLKDLGLAK
jgi:hypothetical protein